MDYLDFDRHLMLQCNEKMLRDVCMLQLVSRYVGNRDDVLSRTTR
jgi:hypothetical protein